LIVSKNKSKRLPWGRVGVFSLNSHAPDVFDDNKLTKLGFLSWFLSVIVPTITVVPS